ncbi:Ribonuclease D [Enhygromyxa salina]|uniref:Ribonuclease D n=1 Tax=Enhygromyxa salina TaxID=215803 RepID=A0A2S9XAZ8_9BACT|nr:ribonuclease D [Enhygromyxa salina]PRP90028.1 Ribonuclease D [Enhygromyxa salina]
MAQLPDHSWVRDADALAQLAAALREAPWVALDSESNSMFVYSERVCLLQFNVGGELWLLDPFALAGDGPEPETLAPLAEPLANPDLRIWVHGGEYDVACLKRDFSLRLTNVFDTQQAASFLGWRRTGYASVVEAVCGIKLAKEHTQYDWGRRPIDASALRYALDDVVHLPEVGAELVGLIADADLNEELEIANRGVTEAAAHDNSFDPARMWRLKGINDLRKDRLGLLAALYTWRDQKGRELDYPPGRLIANEPLVQLAKRAPTDHAALRRARLRASFARSHGAELLEVIEQALREPPKVPERPAKQRPPAREAARAKAIKSWRREEAERRELPPQVVLPPRALAWLVSHDGAELDLDQCPELGAKRAARYGATLRQLCAV